MVNETAAVEGLIEEGRGDILEQKARPVVQCQFTHKVVRREFLNHKKEKAYRSITER